MTGIVLAMVIAVLAVVAIRWMLRNTTSWMHPGRGSLAGNDTDIARSMLRERFDRGEIDADEFETRRRALGD